MNFQKMFSFLHTEYPVGLTGCRDDNASFEACDYDITIFDGLDCPSKVLQRDHLFIKIHHDSLDNQNSDSLVHYDQMQIVFDDSWELQQFLNKIKENRSQIFLDYAKNCILNSIFCCTKSKNGIKSDPFSSCWQKSAVIYLANSILALNEQRPTPSHGLEKLRRLKKNFVTDKISIIHDTLGIERATPSLLERMLKSTIGFSNTVEQNQHDLIIQQKYDYFIKNSMMSDCYFYLIYVNYENFVFLKDSIHHNPDLIYLLKIALDLENDENKLRHNIDNIQKTCNEIFTHLKRN